MDFLSRSSNFEAALKFNNLTPKIANHLSAVYQSLSFTVLCGALGAFAHVKFHIGSVWWTLGLFGIMFALFSTPNTPNAQSKRNGLLAAFGFVQGLVVGPLVESVLHLDPSIVLTAFIGTVIVFACFSLAAIYAERRSMLYLGGFLGSALSLMTFFALANLFFRSSMIYSLHLYGGLLLFSLYIIFDTQMMIEKAAVGTFDVQRDALELFLDFVAIFVRVLIILANNNKKKNENKRR